MKVWATDVDYRRLRLNPAEGFVLSRVDRLMSIRELAAVTNMPFDQVGQIVTHLVAAGALAVGTPFGARSPEPTSTRHEAAAEPDTLPYIAVPRFTPEPEEEVLELTEADVVPETVRDPDVEQYLEVSAVLLVDEDSPLDDAPVDPEEASVLAEETRNERAWRQIYDTVYRPMDRDLRMAEARTVEGANLMALCLDPEPQIIFALQENPRFGLAQARFIAFYHRTQTGLEVLTRNAEIAKDSLVQRRLLRNPQLPAPLLRKIVHSKMLSDTYKIAIDRDVPERTRVGTAELLRRKFTLAGGDEKAALVVKTEARCLLLLTNCAFDAQTTQILCNRTTWTLLTIQNLVRWSATPPLLLRAFLKLPIIRTNPGMRKLLLKHPNMPSDVKRAFNAGQTL